MKLIYNLAQNLASPNLIKTRLIGALALCIGLPLFAQQDLAVFSGTKSPKTATLPNLTAEALTRGPALTAAGGNTFNSGNWETGNKLNVNSYIQWSVSADPGYIITIKELQINFDRDPDGLSHFFTGNGPAKIRLRTSLDNYASDIYSNDKVSNSGLSPTIETLLVSETGGTITFRIYGFSSNIGMLGPLGTFDIEGGLGTRLGLDQVGIRLAGSVTYDGLLYSDNQWTPRPPGEDTGDKNVFVVSGSYSETHKVKVNNLTVHPGAELIIQKTGSITVNGSLTTTDNVKLLSDGSHFASLIAKDTVIGQVRYERQVQINHSINKSGNSTLVSAPLIGETFNTFRLANPNIMSNRARTHLLFGPFSKAKNAYNAYPNTDKSLLTPATGYRVSVTKNSPLVFTGAVLNKPVHKPLLNTGKEQAEWNLIGNPYPSYLSLRDFLAANNSEFAPVASGLYRFDGDPSNGWTVWNMAYLTLYPNAQIAPGQGFFVASKMGGSTATFIPEMQREGPIKRFGRIPEPRTENVGFLKLNLSNGRSEYSTDFYFNKLSSLGLDPGYDAKMYGDEAPELALYSYLAKDNTGLPMTVQSLPYAGLSSKIVVPLGLNAEDGQHLKIGINTRQLPAQIEVYLEDMATETFTLLNTNDYHFYTDSKISGAGRFFLHFNNPVLAFGNRTTQQLQLYTDNGGHQLHIEGAIHSATSVSIFDLQDRRLQTTVLDLQTSKNSLDLSDLKRGVYVVKLKNSTEEVIKKVFVE